MPHKTKQGGGNKRPDFNNAQEAEYFDKISKRELYVIAQQFAMRLVDDELPNWDDVIINERRVLKLNGLL